MKLLCQSDDYGITHAVTCGILKGIEDGIIRNTGLFVNMAASEYAAKQIERYEQACFGIDVNLVSGRPISDPAMVPDLVDSKGFFITSQMRMKEPRVLGKNMVYMEFENDPYPYEQTYLEAENQVKKFKELVGKWPEYIHGHSLITPNIDKALREVGQKYNIIYTFDCWQQHALSMIPCDWNPKPFPLEQQLQTNVEEKLLDALQKLPSVEKAMFICHAGYMEDELFQHTSYTAIRIKDLAAMLSPSIKLYLKEQNIELITYRELKGE